jgi:hypothetical protein
MPTPKRSAAVAILMIASASPSLAAEPALEGLAAELARLRSEIEVLDRTLDDKKEAERTQLRAMASRKLGLDADVEREALRVRQLAEELERARAQVRAAREQQAELEPVVLDAIARMKASLEAGIPFRVADRRAALEALETELAADTLLPSVALSRLWAWVEDEARLTRENGLYSQVISVDGEEVLADVARLGMVMLFFRSPDGRFGCARRVAGAWRFEPFSAAVDLERASALFAALERRVRVGWFVLPPGLSASNVHEGAAR